MMFKILLVVFVALSTNLIVEGAAVPATTNDELPESPQPRTLIYLGNVGTKQFFVAESLVSWQNALFECRNAGLNLVTINTQDEREFVIRRLMDDDRGPFWLGARDIGNKSIFRWTDYITAPNPDDPNTIIGSFINYYNYLEQGPLALQMNSALGSSVFAAHSFSISAKAFCQTG